MGRRGCGGSDCWVKTGRRRDRAGLVPVPTRTPSRLLGLSLADAVGEMRTQNQPGTTDEYPNWRVPLGGPDGRRLLLGDLFTDPRAATLCEALRAAVDTRCNAGRVFTGFTFVTAAICSQRTDQGEVT